MKYIDLGNELSLRPLKKEDKSDLAHQANNFKIWVNLTDLMPHPYSEKDAEAFIDLTRKEEPNKTLAICKTDKVIGMIGITMKTDLHKKSAEFGYWLGENYWRQGITYRAAEAFINYAFETFDIVRLQAGVMAWNPPSMNLLRKLGFEQEGLAKPGIFKNNKFVDEHLFALLRP